MDFQSSFGKNTTTGLVRRFIFAVGPNEDWDYVDYDIPHEPMMAPYSVQIPTHCWDTLNEWKKAKKGRHNLFEPAIRIALVSSFANHDENITDAAMQAALCFMEWQEQIRRLYIAGEAETKEAEIEATIFGKLDKVGFEKRVAWRELYRACHLDRKGAPMVNRVRDGMQRTGVIGFDSHTNEIWLKE
jgi:hypothetical protein